jgi:hypothetical protein
MTRVTRREARTIGGHDIKIDGRRIDVNLARIVYKCENCFGDLERYGMGLRCKNNPEHRGFIHRDRVREIQQQQAQNLGALNEVYEIINGKVVKKCQL